MMKLSMTKINDLYALLAQSQELYLPIEKADKVEFYKWSENERVRLDTLNTVKSAKDFFFPQSEDLVSFKTEGKKIEIIPAKEKAMPTIYFGVKACDVKSFEILDRVFLSDPVDSFYESRRKAATIISLACGKPEHTCFCQLFDIDAAEPKGDVVTWIVENELFWESKTKKGEELTKLVSGLFEDCDEKKVEEHKGQIKAAIANAPLSNLSLEEIKAQELMEIFNSDKWADLSKACLGCGTCTFVCPTCQCYDIRDYNTGNGVQRYRCWDSCMYSDFTMMAHGNNRTTQVERFRQRFMHKLVYFPANNEGEFSCVGCGRCLQRCPVSLNIVKVIKALGGGNNE